LVLWVNTSIFKLQFAETQANFQHAKIEVQ